MLSFELSTSSSLLDTTTFFLGLPGPRFGFGPGFSFCFFGEEITFLVDFVTFFVTSLSFDSESNFLSIYHIISIHLHYFRIL